MLSSIIIAQFLGFLFLLFGIAVLVRPAHIRTALQGILTSPSQLLLATFINLIGGLLLVLFHNVWVMTGALFITLICWIILLRACAMLFIPEKVVAFVTPILDSSKKMQIVAIIHIIIGAIFLAIACCG